MRYKAVTTIGFNFESGTNQAKALEFARKKISEMVNEPLDVDSFTVQLNLIQLKEKKIPKRIGEFTVEEVLPFISTDDYRKTYSANGKEYSVKMNSDRYFVFLRSLRCVACGLEGKKMMLELNPGDDVPHFNLYAEQKGKLILMTKDHIIAKSRGGSNSIDNYQCMCAICNNLKAHHNLSVEAVRELRHLYDNNQKLPRKELKEIINKRRRILESG